MAIVDIQIGYLTERLDGQRIELVVTDAAKKYLADAGYSPVYGARPLKRVIQKEVETALGRLIVAEGVAEGARVVVDARGEQTETKERRPDNIITSTTSGFLGVHPLMPVNSKPSRTPLTPYTPDTRRDTLLSRYEVPQTVAARHALPS